MLTWDCCAPAAATATSKRWRDSQHAPRPPASAAGSASCPPRRRYSRAPGLGSAEGEEMSAAAAPAPERGWKSEKVDEAQALARSCAARRPDFQPCDGLSICATHSHGKCFKLHWCCHLGWCHRKSSLISPPFAAVPGRPRGRPGSRQGLCGLGGSGLGRGCSAAGRGRPGVRAAGTALVPDQSCRRCLGNEVKFVGSLALATSTKGDRPVPGKWDIYIFKKIFFFPFCFSTETTRQCVEKG